MRCSLNFELKLSSLWVADFLASGNCTSVFSCSQYIFSLSLWQSTVSVFKETKTDTSNRCTPVLPWTLQILLHKAFFLARWQVLCPFMLSQWMFVNELRQRQRQASSAQAPSFFDHNECLLKSVREKASVSETTFWCKCPPKPSTWSHICHPARPHFTAHLGANFSCLCPGLVNKTLFNTHFTADSGANLSYLFPVLVNKALFNTHCTAL